MENDSSSSLLGNRYRLLHTLGRGGMSVVYRAHDTMLERPVAIKVLRQDYSRDANFRARFQQEARSAANLSHPNIVTVHDFGYDADRLYIVMEFVPGTDLKTLLKQRGRLGIEETLNLVEQACDGIGYAHRAGFVHCDVKPHNMLVSPEGRLKVTDFGIARALASISPDETSDIVWGSPQYFSPEQAAGQAPSPASDVYSLGVILYELLTGRLPFTSNDPIELVRLHREVNPPPARALNPQIPPELDAIVQKVLSKEPVQRYRTADQFGRILRAYHASAPSANLHLQPSRPVSQPAAQAGPAYAPPASSGAAYANPMPQGPRPANAYPVNSYAQPAAAPAANQADHTFDIDWISIGLGLLTTLAVGGLIPLWLYVFFSLFPPAH